MTTGDVHLTGITVFSHEIVVFDTHLYQRLFYSQEHFNIAVHSRRILEVKSPPDGYRSEQLLSINRFWSVSLLIHLLKVQNAANISGRMLQEHKDQFTRRRRITTLLASVL